LLPSLVLLFRVRLPSDLMKRCQTEKSFRCICIVYSTEYFWCVFWHHQSEDEKELDEGDVRSRKEAKPEEDVMVFNNEIYSPDSRSTSSGRRSQKLICISLAGLFFLVIAPQE
jgi:hypothetical protein